MCVVSTEWWLKVDPKSWLKASHSCITEPAKHCVLWTVAQNHSHCGFGVIFDCFNQIVYSSFSFTDRCAKDLVFYSQENCVVQRHWLEQHFVIELYNWGDIQWGQSGFLVHDVMRLSQKKDCVCVCVTFCADSCSCCSWEDVEPRHCSGSALHPGPVQRPARLHCPHPAAGHTWTSARYRLTLRELIKCFSDCIQLLCLVKIHDLFH